MFGAESLVQTFLKNEINVCFANPGTSEMHFVAALDSHPEMRCILCLFEGGTSGAADGYYRMSGKVAATMLHLAPGFGNAFANLHNASKAGSGLVNVMGEHASHHLKYESPLRGDTVAISQAVSDWTRVASDARSVARDGAEAIRAARSRGGQIATLVLPADAAWSEGTEPVVADPPPPLHRPSLAEIDAAATQLNERGAALLIGGAASFGKSHQRAGQIAQATGARLLSPLFNARQRRGAGTPKTEILPYAVEPNIELFRDVERLVLCGAGRPVHFFAYPGKPSVPEAPSCRIMDLCAPGMDVAWTLDHLAERLAIEKDAPFDPNPLVLPDLPTGPVTVEAAGQVIAALLPEEAVVVNESVTSGRNLLQMLTTARPHDLLVTTGGAIGQCLPAATGAAIACPDRRVVALTGDGSAMYTLQSLWTMARENLNVTVVVFANRGYQILRGELDNLGIGQVGRNAHRMFDIEDPGLDWIALAKGHGVDGVRVATAQALADAFDSMNSAPGPGLIEVKLP